MEALLSVRNLRINFRLDKDTTFEAVKGISFDIPKNATVALVGESGSGKSVTSLSMLGLLPKENSTITPGSEIIYAGQNLVELDPIELRKLRGADISMIFQEPMTSLNPVFTVGFQLTEVLQLHMGLSASDAKRRALALLAEVGIPDPDFRINAYPSQMSGGQQQRVMIAMAIACEPKLLIADEPTTALDVTIQKQILDLIAELQKKHQMSVLFITHDLAVVGEIADYVVVMRNGEIREQGPAKSVFENPQDAYTKALLLCRPRLDRRPVRLPVIEDFMTGQGHAMHLNERKRGIAVADPIILDVRHLGKDFYSREGLFGRRKFEAVKDVSFKLPKGKTLGLVGESGSGKTTVGLTLMRLHEASTGEALFDKYPHEFSGGQRQRIAIARCLTLKPDILICDESVSALDVSVQAQVLNLLQDLQDEFHLSYIFISHDLAVVKYISDQVMVMNQGEIIEIADSDEIYRHPQQPYTKKLLSAIPKGWHHGA